MSLTRLRGYTVSGGQWITVALASAQDTLLGTTKSGRSLNQGIEHFLQIESGPANCLQDVRSGGLPLERLLQFGRTSPLRLEQPRVLDGDHGLVGEGLHERDLRVAEWLHHRLGEGQHANRLALAQKWDRKQRSNFSDDNLVLATELGFGLKIGHMHGAPFEHGPSGERGAIRGYRVILQILCKRWIDDRVREQIEFSLLASTTG